MAALRADRVTRRTLAASIAALVLSACASSGGSADAQCEFPAGTTLAFQDETTLRALGLDALGPVEAHNQVGKIYVTADEIESDRLRPEDAPSRMYCGVYGPDQEVSVIWGPVPADWQPPASIAE